jgi:chromosome segregation ATPase
MRLENKMKALKEKQDEATDIIDEQAREIDTLRLELQTLHNGHDQLGEDVKKTRTLLNSVSSNVDVITKSLQGSSEPSKSKAAQAVSDNSKDNIWNVSD